MITNILISRTDGKVTIHTATEADKNDYLTIASYDESVRLLFKIGKEKKLDINEILWKDRYERDCIMFAIVENESGKTIGFCEIENISKTEPTIGISIDPNYQRKGYGYAAAKMMIEEGWKIFDHTYFMWEVEQDNIPSRKLALKLGGKRQENRRLFEDCMLQVMEEKGVSLPPECFENSIERYAIERPTNQSETK